MMEHHWRTEKIITVAEAKAKAAELTTQGKKLVTINGSFDILHAGHLDFLEEARQQGDILFVGLNSDTSVKEGKGPDRPFIPQHERAAMLAALTCVDYVVIIDAPYNQVQDIILETVQPSIHVNGSEYGPPEKWLEWPAMQQYGVQGHVVERRPGLATSELIKKIRQT